MKQQDSPSPPGAGEEEEFSEPSGSLLELVEPELKSLSKYWLGALKDHALLALPAEYASQLPPQGGMLYRSIISHLRKKQITKTLTTVQSKNKNRLQATCNKKLDE